MTRPKAHLAWHSLPTSELPLEEWPKHTVSCLTPWNPVFQTFFLILPGSHFVIGHSHLIQVGSLPLYRSGD